MPRGGMANTRHRHSAGQGHSTRTKAGNIERNFGFRSCIVLMHQHGDRAGHAIVGCSPRFSPRNRALRTRKYSAYSLRPSVFLPPSRAGRVAVPMPRCRPRGKAIQCRHGGHVHGRNTGTANRVPGPSRQRRGFGPPGPGRHSNQKTASGCRYPDGVIAIVLRMRERPISSMSPSRNTNCMSSSCASCQRSCLKFPDIQRIIMHRYSGLRQSPCGWIEKAVFGMMNDVYVACATALRLFSL